MQVLQKAFVTTLGLALIGVSPWAMAQQTPQQWFRSGQRAVQQAQQLPFHTGQAKNVILFIGDGMGISTVTAARILEGQMRGQSGEENQLSFEKFPFVALAKTYSVNQQTSDSAPTMTAMVTGVKTSDGLLAVNSRVPRGDHTKVARNTLKTVLEISEEHGLSTGVVTTARVTHATPAACYAHAPERDWEADANLSAAALAADFPDIARQLIEFPFGDGLEVAMGGGRSKFLPKTVADPEDAGRTGERNDGRDLTAEWLSKYTKAAYVWNLAQFRDINPVNTDHLLGLFERSHMEYEHDRPLDTGKEPSLSEMTGKAIDILAKNPKGFFLHVESGRIDHGHHAGNAYRALTDTIEFAKAVQVALEKTNPRDTLIIVSADHSHVFTIAGYPKRGNPILGLAQEPGETEPSQDMLGLPYTTLSYANGPGYTGASNAQAEGVKTYPHIPTSYSGITAGRPDLRTVNTAEPNYMQEAAVPLSSETHAGEDVAIYATGPQAYLIHGVQEQHVIFHVIAEAMGFTGR